MPVLKDIKDGKRFTIKTIKSSKIKILIQMLVLEGKIL